MKRGNGKEMDMEQFRKIALLGLLLVNLFNLLWATIGIGTKFATVVVEKLEPGGVYNITQLRNLPLKVINNGDAPTEAAVDIEIPSLEESKEGYDPIPDPDWVRIIPEQFQLKAAEEISCEIIISIPDDKSLIGRHFQAKIWSHSLGEDLFGVGVVNRIFFSIGPGSDTSKEAKRKKLLHLVNFDVNPETIYLTIPLGKKVDVFKEMDKAIKLMNKGKEKVTVQLSSVEKPDSVLMPAEYEFTPNIEFLKIAPRTVTIKSNRIKNARMFLEIPVGEEYKDKRYLFAVKATIIKPDVPMEFYIKVLVITK